MSLQRTKRLGRMALVSLPILLLATPILSGQTQQQGTVFRATTNYVSTDVTVRDAGGKFIPDLTAKDFSVFEDGVPQKIENFLRVVGGRVFSDTTTRTASAGTVSEGLILPPSRPRNDASGRIFIIFIDDSHIVTSDTPRAKDVLKQIRDTVIHDNDLVGFVSTGTSSIEIDPAYDFEHRRFDEAIKKMMGSAPKPQDIINDAVHENSQGPIGMRHAAHTTFRTAYDMLVQLGEITDRRKSFIYVSSGYTWNPLTKARYAAIQDHYRNLNQQPNGEDIPSDDSDSSSGNSGQNASTWNLDPMDPLADPEYRKRTEFAEADLLNELASLIKVARRANVSFYAVDPQGLTAGFGAEMNTMVTYADQRDYFDTKQASLKTISEETGGFCICGTNDFKTGLQRIDAETSDYYMVGYTSTNPDPFKVRRTIKIEVNRPDVRDVLYRPEYLMTRPKEPRR